MESNFHKRSIDLTGPFTKNFCLSMELNNLYEQVVNLSADLRTGL